MKWITMVLLVCAALISLGTRSHHFLINSGLTEMQALLHYWYFWLSCFLLVIAAALVDIFGGKHD